MKYQKKTLVLLLIMFMAFTLSINVKAASITGNSSVNVGDTFSVTFNFGKNVGAYDSLNVSYDSNMLEYVSGDPLSEKTWYDESSTQYGIASKTYTFKAKSSGSTKIVVVGDGVVRAEDIEYIDAVSPGSGTGKVSAEKLINISQAEPQEPTPVTPPTQKPNVSNDVTANGNNYLKYLQISEEGMTPGFTRNVTDYSIAVGENVSSIQVLARAEDASATVQVTGHENIVNGDNTIQIKVTAQNGSTKIYKILVTKSQDKEKSNAYLESLIVENFELDPKFQSEILEYDLGMVLSNTTSLNVVANAKDNNAKIEILGADKLVPEGFVVVRVTAPDGVTTKEYKLKYSLKEATEEEIVDSQMKDYLKDIQNTDSTKTKVFSYLKYIWSAIKKNYLLVLMYILIIIEFIQIVVLRRKLKKVDRGDGGDDPDNDNRQKDILKVEVEEKTKNDVQDLPQVTEEPKKIEPPQVTLLDDKPFEEPTRRKGNLSKADGIKLVDLDNEEQGPQDELTFNIFENLNEDDIKRLLNEDFEEDNRE